MLNITIENDEIVIRIPIETLKTAFELSPHIQNYLYPDVAHVSNLFDFANSVVDALQHEKEDGSTFVHDAFDSAFEYMIEWGDDGIEITKGEVEDV